MFRLLRLIFWCIALLAIWWFATTVPLGKYTLWGHLKRIWNSQEAQDLVKGAEDAAKPAIEKAKGTGKAGIDAGVRSP